MLSGFFAICTPLELISQTRRPWSFVLGTQSVLGPWSGLGPESLVRAPRTEDLGRTQDFGRTKHEGPRTKDSSRRSERLADREKPPPATRHGPVQRHAIVDANQRDRCLDANAHAGSRREIHQRDASDGVEGAPGVEEADAADDLENRKAHFLVQHEQSIPTDRAEG